MNTAALAHQPHNHQHCVTEAMQTAHAVCKSNGTKFTQLRKQVFELIWCSHQPLGAYRLMDMLSASETRRVAPPTVYRALEFLLEQGLIHRINSLNAYIGCPHPDQPHDNYFLICKSCGNAMECEQSTLQHAIAATVKPLGFDVLEANIEIVGRCQACSANAEGND